MLVARRLGFERLAWGLRRLHCPVRADALVLEVGSGGNPYARANVLLDAYPESRERHWVPLTLDRPFVFGFLEKLPFKDKSFDFVIASHVLEHSSEPDRALAEMQRVAKAGYIEVPDAFMERLNPYKDHRAEITLRGGQLIVRKKAQWVVDADLQELYEPRAKVLFTGEVIPSRPFFFHVRHYWQDQIEFDVVNPEVDSSWDAPGADNTSASPLPVTGPRETVRTMLRRIMSQSYRNSRIDVSTLLACPTCSTAAMRRVAGGFDCEACRSTYPDRDGRPMLYPAKL